MVTSMSFVLIYTNTWGVPNEVITTSIISGFLGYLTKSGIDLYRDITHSDNISGVKKGEQDEEINNCR